MTRADSGTKVPWASQLIVDSTNVYWLDEIGRGTINKVPTTGGDLLPFDTGLLFGFSNQQFTVDSTSLYWLGGPNGDDVPIMKITPK